MKALSIQMPWAYLCAAGIKPIENRTWNTGYRGRFFIHAGKKFDTPALQDWRLKSQDLGGLITVETGIKIAWLVLLWDRGISGIIGEATMVGVATKSSSPWFEGPYGFKLADAKLYTKILPCRGRLGFFEPTISGTAIDIQEQIAELEEQGVKP